MRMAALFVMLGLMAGSATAQPVSGASPGLRTTPGAQLPLQARFVDEAGRPTTLKDALGHEPAVLVFADYRCNNVCGPALSIAAAALGRSGLKPGRDYRLVVVGLRPNEPVADSRAFHLARLTDEPDISRSAVLLTGGASAVRAVTAAAGYGYAFDAKLDQFIHPVAAFVITPAGEVSEVLPELALTDGALRSGLRQAGEGRTDGLIDRILVLCHALIPSTGVYDRPVQQGLRAGAVAFLIALGGGIALLARRGRVKP